MKKYIYAILLFSFAIIAVVLICYISYEKECDSVVFEKQNYIAHAGGQIDGHNYTNSKEAIENSIKKGIKHIELDLRLTSDSILVATHAWEEFNQMVNNADTNHVPTLNEFKASKLYGKYTPVSYQDIDSILAANPDIILVTDKTSDPAIIDKYLGKFKNRMMVECFSLSDYFYYMDNGYLLSMYAMTLQRQLFSYLTRKLSGKSTRYNAGVIDMEDYASYHSNSKFIYTAPNRSEADKLFRNHPDIRFIYVDDISQTK